MTPKNKDDRSCRKADVSWQALTVGRGLRHTVVRGRTMIADAAQYQELAKLYGTYGDEELLVLARGMADLTETAQEVLKSEIARRGLTASVGETARPEEPSRLSEDELTNLRAYAALAPPECVFEFKEEHGASAAYRALEEEGIDSVLLAGDGPGEGQRGPRVVVAPGDAQRAEALLSHPLAARFRSETAEETPAEFDLPVCPACGGGETLLETVDPVNHWSCEGCGHSWVEDGGALSD